MADESEFKIKITADVESAVSGAQQTAEALNGVKVGVTDGVSPALANLSDTQTKLKGNTDDLKSAYKGLAAEFPLLGQVGRLAMNSIAISAFALGIVLKGLQSVFDGIFQRINTGTGGGNFRAGLDALNVAATEGEVEFRKYQRALEDAAGAQDSVKEKTDKAIASMRAQAVALVESQNAQKAVELARINLQEAQGKLSGPAAITARMEVEERYARQKVQAEVQAREAELKAKHEELEQLRLAAYTEEHNIESLKKQADEAATALSRHTTLLAESKKTKAEVDKQVKALENPPFLGPGMLDQRRSAQSLQSQLALRIGVMSGETTDVTDRAAATRARYEAARNRAIGLRTSATRLGLDLPGEQSAAEQLTADAFGILSLQRTSRNYDVRAQLTEQMNRGKAQEQQISASIAAAFESKGAISAELLAALDRVTKENKELAKQIKQVSSQAGGMRNP